MRKAIPAAMVASLMLVACARSATLESGGDVASAIPADASSLPEGTVIDVRLDREIGTRVSQVGDTFTTTVVNNIIAQSGEMVVPAGAKVYGTVTGLDGSERMGEPAAIRIDLHSLRMNGRDYPLSARVMATDLQTRSTETREETLKKAGVGAAAGAVLGAVVSGGELEKILLGGALGAAAGTVISLGAGEAEAVLPQGTELKLQTTRVVALQ